MGTGGLLMASELTKFVVQVASIDVTDDEAIDTLESIVEQARELAHNFYLKDEEDDEDPIPEHEDETWPLGRLFILDADDQGNGLPVVGIRDDGAEIWVTGDFLDTEANELSIPKSRLTSRDTAQMVQSYTNSVAARIARSHPDRSLSESHPEDFEQMIAEPQPLTERKPE
jgi:hypothetical protein